jgi:putative FmdB family regulatory protein
MFYDYHCSHCSYGGERSSSVNDRDNQTCPDCGALLTRIPSYAAQCLGIPARHKATAEQLPPLYTDEEYRSLRDQGWEPTHKVLGT